MTKIAEDMIKSPTARQAGKACIRRQKKQPAQTKTSASTYTDYSSPMNYSGDGCDADCECDRRRRLGEVSDMLREWLIFIPIILTLLMFTVFLFKYFLQKYYSEDQKVKSDFVDVQLHASVVPGRKFSEMEPELNMV